MALSIGSAYHPLAAVVMAWIHFGFFFIFMMYWFFKGNKEPSQTDKIISYITQGSMAVMNIGLIIAGADKVNNQCS